MLVLLALLMLLSLISLVSSFSLYSKYSKYFKEVLFCLQLYIAKVNSKQTGISNAISLKQNMNENDDKTFTIFNVMAGSIIFNN